MPAHALSVGGLYDPYRTEYPTTEQVRLGRSVAELVRYWPGATDAEIHAHNSGAAQFALIDESPDVMVLAYKYGDLEWSDAPFQAHRMPQDLVGWPGGGPAERILFRTVLVDAMTGRVLALRYDDWSPAFANAVRVSIAEQLVHDFDDTAAGSRLHALYERYSTPNEMVRARAIATHGSDAPKLGGHAELSVHHY